MKKKSLRELEIDSINGKYSFEPLMKLIIAFIIENLNHPIFIVNVSVRGFRVMDGLRIFDCGGGGQVLTSARSVFDKLPKMFYNVGRLRGSLSPPPDPPML